MDWTKKKRLLKLCFWLEEQRLRTREVATYRLRDWLFSRQRYWGEPIPIIHWGRWRTSTVVPESELPLFLSCQSPWYPGSFSGTGESPLANLDWSHERVAWCQSSWKPISHAMYWFKPAHRHIDRNNTEKLADGDLLKTMVASRYLRVGGAEHVPLLLYACFWHKFLLWPGKLFRLRNHSKKPLTKGWFGTSHRDHRGAFVATE